MLSGSTSPKGKKSVDTELLGMVGAGGGHTIRYIWGRLNSKGHVGQSPPGELTRAYYRLCRDSDRVGNRRAKEP